MWNLGYTKLTARRRVLALTLAFDDAGYRGERSFRPWPSACMPNRSCSAFPDGTGGCVFLPGDRNFTVPGEGRGLHSCRGAIAERGGARRLHVRRLPRVASAMIRLGGGDRGAAMAPPLGSRGSRARVWCDRVLVEALLRITGLLSFGVRAEFTWAAWPGG